jgi:hypothetical protein
MITQADEIRNVLQRFQDGYSTRDISQLEKFMGLFIEGDATELIGIGAYARNQDEWFQGTARIQEIVKSDWTYWGDVRLEVGDTKITVNGDTAWLTTTGSIFQTDHIYSDEVTEPTLDRMKEILNDKSMDPRTRLVEATHFGVQRWREREKKAGYRWPFVFTAILIKQGNLWRFHTIHWSMPVD